MLDTHFQKSLGKPYAHGKRENHELSFEAFSRTSASQSIYDLVKAQILSDAVWSFDDKTVSWEYMRRDMKDLAAIVLDILKHVSVK
jgi:hypothetical protein